MPEDPNAEDVGRVLAAVQRTGLPRAQVEDLTVDILRRWSRGCGPRWLRTARARTRLDVLTVLAVLDVTR